MRDLDTVFPLRVGHVFFLKWLFDFFLMENRCTVQKSIYSENLSLPPTPLISKFPFPEAATTTDMCICLEIPCIYKHGLFNLVHVARENFFNRQVHPSFPLEASRCTEDQDSKFWQGLQNPPQLSNVLSSHIFPCTMLQPHWPSLLSYLRTFAYGGHTTWALSPLPSPSDAPSGVRLHTTSSERYSWLPSLNWVLHILPARSGHFLWSIFLIVVIYLFVFNICLQLD